MPPTMHNSALAAFGLAIGLLAIALAAFGAGQPQESQAPADQPGTRISSAGYNITPLSEQRIAELAEPLTDEQRRILLEKGTEPRFCGPLLDNTRQGHYTCALCTLPLFSSDTKFDSGTGWPSFTKPYDDDHIRTLADNAFGMTRTEIRCARCDGHLGHVFGDGPPPTGRRYCLNSAALVFVDKDSPMPDLPANDTRPDQPAAQQNATETAYLAGGCFWGIEHRLQQLDGVIDAASGYMGGHTDNPTYRQVCSGTTGHTETVRIIFDPETISYQQILKAFFRLHDPTTPNRQGPDVGTQYRSAIFPVGDDQLAQTKAFIADQAESRRFRGKSIVTQVLPAEQAGTFWLAEAEHQDYNERTGHACWLPVIDDDDLEDDPG